MKRIVILNANKERLEKTITEKHKNHTFSELIDYILDRDRKGKVPGYSRRKEYIRKDLIKDKIVTEKSSVQDPRMCDYHMYFIYENQHNELEEASLYDKFGEKLPHMKKHRYTKHGETYEEIHLFPGLEVRCG